MHENYLVNPQIISKHKQAVNLKKGGEESLNTILVL